MSQPEKFTLQNTRSRIIGDLRRNGYCRTYTLSFGHSIICLDDGIRLNNDIVKITLVDYMFNLPVSSPSLLFTVEVNNGDKGIMTISMEKSKQQRNRKPNIISFEDFWLAL